MDNILTVLNSWNFQAWRAEIFSTLRQGKKPSPEDLASVPAAPNSPVAAQKAEKPSPEDLARVRAWMREALKPASQIAQLYRVLEVDLDGDICRAVPAFLPSAHFGPLDSRYALRMFWRVLFRRSAIGQAWRLSSHLSANEPFLWRVWRVKDYSMPRLLVGVLLGFFILLSSSGLVDVFKRLQNRACWYVVPLVFLLSVFCLAFANIQRQVGRSSGRVLIRRSCALVGYGVVYTVAGAIGGATVHYWGTPHLWCQVTRPFVWLCAAAAMLLGFVFQLFWQDQALGDPL